MSDIPEKKSPLEGATYKTDDKSDSSQHHLSLESPTEEHLEKSTGSKTITNPLLALSKVQLLERAREFAVEKGLEEDIDLIQRGALLAQKPANFHTIDELAADEKAAVDNEHKK